MLITKDACMKFYDASWPLCIETDSTSLSLEPGLLQVRDGMNCGCDKVPNNVIFNPTAFASKSVSSMEGWCSNIEREALGLLHGLENFSITVLLMRYM